MGTNPDIALVLLPHLLEMRAGQVPLQLTVPRHAGPPGLLVVEGDTATARPAIAYCRYAAISAGVVLYHHDATWTELLAWPDGCHAAGGVVYAGEKRGTLRRLGISGGRRISELTPVHAGDARFNLDRLTLEQAGISAVGR